MARPIKMTAGVPFIQVYPPLRINETIEYVPLALTLASASTSACGLGGIHIYFFNTVFIPQLVIFFHLRRLWCIYLVHPTCGIFGQDTVTKKQLHILRNTRWLNL